MSQVDRRMAKVQQAAVAELVRGKRVWDLGSGSGELAGWLCDQGATAVEGVDRNYGRPELVPRVARPGLVFTEGYFHTWQPAFPADVAFLSWPVNWRLPGLARHLRQAPVCVYLGLNQRNSACGSADLWVYLLSRELTTSIPGERSDLLVYGKHLDILRSPACPEEVGAVENLVYEFRTIWGHLLSSTSEETLPD